MVKAGELEQIAPGYYLRPGELDDTSVAWASISLRKPSATICLLSALSVHDLTDEIPRATDIALPRGERNLIARFQPFVGTRSTGQPSIWAESSTAWPILS